MFKLRGQRYYGEICLKSGPCKQKLVSHDCQKYQKLAAVIAHPGQFATEQEIAFVAADGDAEIRIREVYCA
jgi:hypothetical protein